MTALHTLAAFVMLGSAAPSQATADCDPTDHGCKARRSEQKAASATHPDDRATYLRSAHLSYISLFDRTGDVRDLCTARRVFEASLAIGVELGEGGQHMVDREVEGGLGGHGRLLWKSRDFRD